MFQTLPPGTPASAEVLTQFYRDQLGPELHVMSRVRKQGPPTLLLLWEKANEEAVNRMAETLDKHHPRHLVFPPRDWLKFGEKGTLSYIVGLMFMMPTTTGRIRASQLIEAQQEAADHLEGRTPRFLLHLICSILRREKVLPDLSSDLLFEWAMAIEAALEENDK